MLKIHQFVFGPVQENTYILYDEGTREAAIVDPGCMRHSEEEKLRAAYGNRIDFEQLPLPSEQLRGYGIPLPLEDVPMQRYTLVGQGDTIQLGREELRVLFVPGHAPGHIAFYAPDSGLLLSGDTLLLGTIGRTDFWYGDYDQLVTSIREQYLPLPDETIVFSGHGEETTIGYERQHNPFL